MGYYSNSMQPPPQGLSDKEEKQLSYLQNTPKGIYSPGGLLSAMRQENDLGVRKQEAQRYATSERNRLSAESRQSAEKQAAAFNTGGTGAPSWLRGKALRRWQKKNPASTGAVTHQVNAANAMMAEYAKAKEAGMAAFDKSGEQGRADLAPWRQAGVDALGQLQSKIAAGPGEFEKSPGISGSS